MSSYKPLIRRYMIMLFIGFIILSFIDVKVDYIQEIPLLTKGYYDKIIIYPGGYCSIKSTYNITYLFDYKNIKILRFYVINDYNLTGLTYYIYKIINVNPVDKVVLEFKSKVYIYDFKNVKKYYDIITLSKYLTLAFAIALFIIDAFFIKNDEYLEYEDLNRY